jgi:hypothetical protein
MFVVRHSVDQDFYYILEIDEDGNEKLIAEDKDLEKLKAHNSIKGTEVTVEDDK